MARPKTVKTGQKLNLYVPKTIKQALYKLATDRRQSMSAVVTNLILEKLKPEGA
jgi:rRNA-processing protein FCF1